MAQAETRDSTPRINSPKIPKARARQLTRQQRKTAAAAKKVTALREKAREEIDRLIAFLDASDAYVSTELEEDISADLEDVRDVRAVSFARWYEQSNAMGGGRRRGYRAGGGRRRA